LRADRNIKFLLLISVVIPQQDAERPVGIREPPFESRCDTLPRIVKRLERQILARGGRNRDCGE